ncbi:MAG: hypothetical protein LBM99_00525 [Bacillales bacterium]|jgi:flavodoxin|nr:hypothetical protein [Bacillales bacterium]
MKVQVIYQTLSGHSRKVAEALALPFNVLAKPFSQYVNQETDLLFIGGGIYAGKLNKKFEIFLNSLSNKNIKKVVIFTTSASDKSAFEQIKAIFLKNNIEVADSSFTCRGRFLFMNWHNPNKEDLTKATEFAKTFI